MTTTLKFAASRSTSERAFETLYDEACVRNSKGDALFDALVRFPSHSVQVERAPKDHRSPAHTRPDNPTGRPTAPFIADAIAHFAAPTVAVRYSAPSFVAGASFDPAAELRDCDIDYRADEPSDGAGGETGVGGAGAGGGGAGAGAGAGGAKRSAASRAIEVAEGSSSGELARRSSSRAKGSFTRDGSGAGGVTLGRSRQQTDEQRAVPFETLRLEHLKPVLSRAARTHLAALAEARVSLLRLVQPSFRWLDTEQYFCNRTHTPAWREPPLHTIELEVTYFGS